MSTSTKKVGIVGAATAALSAMAMGVAAEVVEAEKPKTKPQSRFPVKAALKKMNPEQRAYWERRLKDAHMPPSWNKPRNVQLPAGRVRAEMPEPMTRQVRRAEERRLVKASGRGVMV